MLDRRSFLCVGAGATAAAFLSDHGAHARIADSQPPMAAFVVVGDTHYAADPENPSALLTKSQSYNAGLIDTINALAGREIPENAGGGRVGGFEGVLHVGDLIESGDKNGKAHERMQRTEWAAWEDDYGLDGIGGRLKVPVYEIHGNHDSPHGGGLVLDAIAARNRRRGNLRSVSANGLHYSWDAGAVHFVHLGITVGELQGVSRKRRYNALGSLDFLVDDLARNVGTSRNPVILCHHVDFARYCEPVSEEAALRNEWDYADVAAFYEAIKPYRVAGIFYGHTHARGVYGWTGPKPVPLLGGRALPPGIPTFNTDNAAHFAGPAQAFLYAEVFERDILVRELATRDGWATSQWTPVAWRLPHHGV